MEQVGSEDKENLVGPIWGSFLEEAYLDPGLKVVKIVCIQG